MKTITEELRMVSDMIYLGEKIQFGRECELMDRAANTIEIKDKEIERLSKEIKRLNRELKKYARHSK